MIDHRTWEEKQVIALKVTSALTKEAIILHHNGNSRSANAIFDYLMEDDAESFVRLYDILTKA